MKKEYLTYIFIAGLLYLGYDFYDFQYGDASPAKQNEVQVTQLKTEIDQKSKKIKESQEFFKNLEAKKIELRSLSQQLVSMKSTLTETFDLPGVMKMILAESKNVGVTITSLQPMEQIKRQYYVEQPFTVTFNCVFVQLIALLVRLAQNRIIVRIEDFSIKPKSGSQPGSKYVELDGTLKIKTFYYLGTREDTIASDNPNAKKGGA